MTVRELEGLTVPASGTYDLDASHTTLTIVARHLMVSKVRGRFGTFGGTITVADDPTASTVEVEVEAASISTQSDDRDGHLRSPDFLDVENHPSITFKSTSVLPDGKAWKLVGDLTLRGVTKSIELEMEYLGTMVDPWGSSKAVFEATGTVNREDFGLVWNAPLEAGGVLVSKNLDVIIEAQAGLRV